MHRIKCGVIGAGWWATYAHIPALLAHPSAELIGIQKRDPIEARKVADDFGIPNAFISAAELLAVDGLQAVVISSSPNLHYQQTVAALKAGKHVLIEKPMTLTALEALELVDLAVRHNLQLLVSCPWHYTVHASTAQRMIREGELGKIRMISMLMTNPISHLLRGSSTRPTHAHETPYLQPHASTYSDPKIAGGGQIYTQVSHAAAYLAFLTGAWPKEVFARLDNDGAEVDIYDILNIRMNDGCLASIASTGATSIEQRDFEVRVFGTHGILLLDLWRGTMEFISIAGERRRFPNLAEDEIYPHLAPATNLIDSVIDPARNQSPATLGAAAMIIIEAACHSAGTGKDFKVQSF